ncbi:Hsp70 protein [Polaromonas sp. OV174]|uniref:Hsp70 family protein n=1 Tax=Polaromonas sp. OV174 TaxID=1855300 RepID=UPI0008E4CC0E|nr:Hsp70 family protein [Polaromonas sp. OV174]SFC19506.1 Hsp70 protein [Polaromonas sp. OV174]
MDPQYLVGIDLGTTHTVVAYAPIGAKQAEIQLFDIAQAVAPGEVAALPLLPSCRYHAAAGELAEGALQLPWPQADDSNVAPVVMGQWARKLGAQVPGRLVASAKSWLSHAAVDRQAPILPWGAADDVPKVSPVEASASYLRYVRSAWNWRFPESPLEQQELVLTVPASFDEGARALTLAAARQAGLPRLRLLEEPQAAFYDWLLRHRGQLAEELAQTRLVLVCDVGGGTTDLSLIKVEMSDGQPQLTRIGVGKHLMLGGDNMDLALAHAVEARMASSGENAPARQLSASQLAQLMERCRAVKEQLLAADAPAQTTVTLLGSGAHLVGGSRTAVLSRDEVERLIVDGFFPAVDADARATQARGGIVAFGLPYARDAAVTRHIADFLRQHGEAMPDTLLLNGGVFRADALVKRLEQTLGAWRGAPLRLLHNDNPDVAVARGAVAHALAQRGAAPSIGGGSARSYFLQLDDTKDSKAKAQGICLLPRGSEPGRELLLSGRSFALRLGQPVRFQLFSAISNAAQHTPAQLGELVALNDEQHVRLPPIVMVLQAPANTATVDPAHSGRQDIAVQLATALTEVGTLELHCVSLADSSQRWRLEFDLRHGKAGADETTSQEDRRAAARMAEAISQIDRIFGTNKQAVSPKEVTQLRAQLERLLGDRASWTTPVLRQLYDALWQRARGRRRSAAHERAWLNLAGFCLRPGFGDALDEWRVQQLWPQHALGVQHTSDKQVGAEWWTLWRRVAGGLAASEQLRLLDDFAFNLQINEEGDDEAPAAKPVPGSSADMLRLGAALERIPPAYKSEIGAWLLGRVAKALASKKARSESELANDSLSLWTLGRIGARQPVHGSTHEVVPAEVAAAWVEALLALDWKRVEAAAFAAVQLARVTDDRARDLPLPLREQIMTKLAAVHAPPAWLALVRERVELDEATERRVLGEALPPGLKLMA